MSGFGFRQLFFLLDKAGALLAFREHDTAWAGVVAFSSEDKAVEFRRDSRAEECEIVALDTDDDASIAGLISQVKKGAARYLLLDLHYRTGRCIQVEFDGAQFGEAREKFFSPA